MIKIYLFADSYKHFEEGIKEYEKRLWKNVEIIKLKPHKSENINLVVNSETQILKEKLQKEKWFKILLYIDSKNLSTEELNEFIENKKQTYSDIVFVIWWAFWVNYEELKDVIDFRLSFSKMTFPHSMAYMILLEQIYRCIMITSGKSYHH